MKIFKERDRVIVNGQDGRILQEYSKGMYEVRLFDGCHVVGDVCVSTNDIKEAAK